LRELIITAWKEYFEVLKRDLAVGHWTLDNADNNDTFMFELEKLLKERDIPFDHKDRRIRCFPHILNICTGHVLEAITDTSLAEIAGAWTSSLPQDLNDRQTYEEALRRDPIALGQTKYKLSQMEWTVLQDFQAILEVPHSAIQALSSESLPTVCNYLRTFEKFYVNWKRMGENPNNLRLSPFINKGLEWADKYYTRMGDTKAYLISMVLNPNERLKWIKKHWDAADVEATTKVIHETMSEYRKRETTDVSVEQNIHHPPSPKKHQMLRQAYGLPDNDNDDEETNSRNASFDTKTVQDDRGTDSLSFWEMNINVYPTLFAMAMDYLPVQGSAVPCEQIFSSSAETDTKKRNRIKPVLMEALQMLKFFYKKSRLNFTTGLVIEEKDLEEAGAEDLLAKLFSNNVERADASLDRILNVLAEEDES
ncbi:hypothetical protein HYDPIDRAFT_102399, partial [Hydnomerulius pinastri MD-312]